MKYTEKRHEQSDQPHHNDVQQAQKTFKIYPGLNTSKVEVYDHNQTIDQVEVRLKQSLYPIREVFFVGSNIEINTRNEIEIYNVDSDEANRPMFTYTPTPNYRSLTHRGYELKIYDNNLLKFYQGAQEKPIYIQSNNLALTKNLLIACIDSDINLQDFTTFLERTEGSLVHRNILTNYDMIFASGHGVLAVVLSLIPVTLTTAYPQFTPNDVDYQVRRLARETKNWKLITPVKQFLKMRLEDTVTNNKYQYKLKDLMAPFGVIVNINKDTKLFSPFDPESNKIPLMDITLLSVYGKKYLSQYKKVEYKMGVKSIEKDTKTDHPNTDDIGIIGVEHLMALRAGITKESIVMHHMGQSSTSSQDVSVWNKLSQCVTCSTTQEDSTELNDIYRTKKKGL